MSTVVGAPPGVIASGQTPPPFSPLSIPWHAALWASDPSWTPPADGAQVTSWRNAGSLGGASGPADTGRGAIYRAASAMLNGKPANEWNGTNTWMFRPTVSPGLFQPNHIVGVAALATDAPDYCCLIDCFVYNNNQVMTRDGRALSLYAGTSQSSPAGVVPVGVPMIISALFDQAASKGRINGVDYPMPGTVGVSDISGDLNLGCAYGGGWPWKGHIAFLGVCDRALTAQEITDLEQWAKTFYGVALPAASTDVLLEPFNNLSVWDATIGPPQIVAGGRTGTAVQCTGSTTRATYSLASKASEYVTVGFAWRTNTTSVNQRSVCELWSGAGGTPQIRLAYNGTTAQTFTVYRGTGTASPLGTSSGVTVAVNTWAYIELQTRLHDTLGSVTVRINGTTVVSLTGIDTRVNADTVFDTLRLTVAVSGLTNLWDDLYISTGAAAPFKGSITIP